MSASPGDELLTVSEIAQQLKLNEQTVRNWIDAGKLDALRVGPRRLRVRRSDLDAFLGVTSPDSQPEESPAAEEPEEDLWDRVTTALAEGLSDEDRVELADRLRALADVLSSPRRGRR